jgi:large subunit ribosomal protein L19
MRNKMIELIESKMFRKNIPNFTPGDTVRVHTRIREGDKERIQVFEGTVIARRHAGLRSSFTVRKVSYGVGVERIFPYHSPRIDHVEVVSGGASRRAKLFYLRGLQGKAARLKEQDVLEAEGAPARE